MSYPWNMFGKLANEKQLSDYIKDRAYRHGGYCHYTNLKTLNNILKSKTLWLTNVSGFNDKADSRQYKEGKYNFALCFSTGINENLSLWYMYAGMDGHGGRLRMTKSDIKKLTDNAKYFLYEKDKNTNEMKKLVELKKNETMKSAFKDIIYFHEEDNEPNVSLKYNTMTNYIISKEEFQRYKNKNIGFCKGLIWYYEKETRLNIELIGKAKKIIDNNKNSQKDYIITLSLEPVFKNIKIDFAPENLKIEDITSEYSEIKNFILETSNVSLSQYKGDIEMRLCDKCTKIKNCEECELKKRSS